MRFSSIHFRFTELLLLAGVFFCLAGFNQNSYAQSQAISKEVAPKKDPLNLNNLFNALRSDKASPAQRNQLLIQGVKQRGISFALTTDVEEELIEQGASKALIEAIRKESDKLLATSFYYRERADDFRIRKNYDEAFTNYNKSLEYDAGDKATYNNRGHLYQELKRYNEALADFTKVIEIDPTDRNGYNNRGVIYYLQNEYQQAIEDFTKAIEIDPNFREAYLNRANAFQMMGQLRSAETDRQQAKNLKP